MLLIGVDIADLQISGMGLSAGLKGMMRRVVEKANEKMVEAVRAASQNAPPERTDAGAVRALVDVIKKEDVAVVVNLDEKIQVRT